MGRGGVSLFMSQTIDVSSPAFKRAAVTCRVGALSAQASGRRPRSVMPHPRAACASASLACGGPRPRQEPPRAICSRGEISSGRRHRLTWCMTTHGAGRSTLDELDLLAAARAGDELAFGVLVSHHRPGLELFCQLILGCPDRAHDAVTETLLRGWRDLRCAAPCASARIWLYRLATDVCLADLDTAR